MASFATSSYEKEMTAIVGVKFEEKRRGGEIHRLSGKARPR